MFKNQTKELIFRKLNMASHYFLVTYFVLLLCFLANLSKADPIPANFLTTTDDISTDAYHLFNQTTLPPINLSIATFMSSLSDEDNNHTHDDLLNQTLDEVPRPPANLSDCRLHLANKFVYSRLRELIDAKFNLIEYNLHFPHNYTTNPMLEAMLTTHRGDRWSRVTSHQGRTLLSLAFNYGILSLMTLKLGTEVMNVDLVDEPIGCLGERDEQGKIDIVLDLLLRDFREDEDIHFETSERVCYETVEKVNGYAKFTVVCCGKGVNEQFEGQGLMCQPCYPNGWLTFLYLMIATVRFSVLAFGPLFFLSAISSLTRDESPYTVKLKDPLIKTIALCRQDTVFKEEIKAMHILDLSNKRGFPKLRESVYNSPGIGKPFQAKIVQYDVLVNYRRLLTENRVPIGFWKTIARSIIFCKLRNLEPFHQCCR